MRVPDRSVYEVHSQYLKSVSKPSSVESRVRPLRVLSGSADASFTLPRPALDDSEILTLIRAGDTSAATALHDRVRPVVNRTLLRLLGRSDQDLEDLAQQALMQIVLSVHRYRGECSLDSWVSAVTAHVVYKQIRKRRLERRVFEGFTDGVAEMIGPASLARQTLLRSGLARLNAHLESLDPVKIWTYLLHDVCGYDLREIAQITEVSVTAAQSRLVRGRRELHERIAGDPELRDLIEELGASS